MRRNEIIMVMLLGLWAFAVCTGAGCGDNVPPDIAPDATVDAPTCAPCNGPGCEDLDAACMDVESASHAIVCTDDFDFGAPNEFTTIIGERIVRCRCDTETCAPFPACSSIDPRCANPASISHLCNSYDVCYCDVGTKQEPERIRCAWDGPR